MSTPSSGFGCTGAGVDKGPGLFLRHMRQSRCPAAGNIDMKLEDNDIHLHYVQPDRVIDPGLLEGCESLLTHDEKQQMSRFYFDRHKHQFLITRALIRSCLSLYHDVRPAEWVFAKNAYDKPHIAGPGRSTPIHFNISHANGLVICAFTRKYAIGADVEDSHRTTQAALKRLSSYFSEREIEALEALPETVQMQRFFDIWTLKESYIKARGGGFSIPLRKFRFEFDDDLLKHFHIDTDLDDEAENWQFWRLSAPPAYRLAIAVNTANPAMELSTFNSVPLTAPKPHSLPQLSRYPICPSA